uniref:Salivary lipocalin n=1 Tax=Strongyloides venezuelensis TaxID=75913 RepID=A0A0K0FZI0_STRVS
MKYSITYVILAVVIFVTVNGKKRPKTPTTRTTTTTTAPSPPKWQKWNGTKPFKAEDIARNGTKIYNAQVHTNYTFDGIISNQTRNINGIDRYRVRFNVKSCTVQSKGSKKKPVVSYKCERISIKLQAVLKDNKTAGRRTITVKEVGSQEKYTSTTKLSRTTSTPSKVTRKKEEQKKKNSKKKSS